MPRFVNAWVGFASIGLCGFLAGCSASFDALPAGGLVPSGLGAIQGKVHGGNQPVAGAAVYVYAASLTAYGGAGIAASTSNASKSLLTAAVLTNSAGYSGMDGNGNYYVKTKADGSFSIGGDYTCTAGTQVYLYAVGGNPGSGVNTAAGFLAALGACPTAGNLAATVPYVWVNEVSTVAAAYAMAGFATDATHVGTSGSTLGQTGIANAFLNAANLAGVATGAALAKTPAGNGTAPQATVNSLANSLAACVNSASSGSTSCTTLLGAALSAGATGTKPTDTATVAINIAHYPGNAVATIYGLGSGTGAPFQPALGSAPNDFMLPVQYAGVGYNSSFGTGDLAIDASGNVWVLAISSGSGSTLASTLNVLSSTGVVLSSQPTGGALSMAIKPNGSAWLAGTFSNFYGAWGPPSNVNYSNSGFVYLPGYGDIGSATFCAGPPYGTSQAYEYEAMVLTGVQSTYSYDSMMSVGPQGDVGFTADQQFGTVTCGAGNAYYPSFPTHIEPGTSLVSTSNGLYITGNYYVVEVSQTYGVTNLSNPNGNYGASSLVNDGRSNLWVANSGANTISRLSSLSPYGTAIFTDFTGGGITNPTGLAVDGEGNIWIANNSQTVVGGTSVSEVNNSGVPLSPSTGFAVGFTNPGGKIAVDLAGSVWIPNVTGTVTQLVGAGAPTIAPLVSNTGLLP